MTSALIKIISVDILNEATLFAVLFILGYKFIRENKFLFALFLGLFGTFSYAAIATSIAFIPNDWNACRMAIPLSLLFGENLYPDLINHPSNCFVYLPVGAWIYLPSAILTKLSGSISICLLSGWIEMTTLYFSPIIVLLLRSNRPLIEKSLYLMIAIVITFSNASLRYVATMIHVDAVGLALAGCAVALAVPLTCLNKTTKLCAQTAGVLMGLSIFTKQTFWPPIVLLTIFLFILNKKEFGIQILIFFIGSFFTCIILTLAIESPDFIWVNVFRIPTHVPQAISVGKAIKSFCYINYKIILILAALIIVNISAKKITKDIEIIALLFLIALISSASSIYSYTKWGSSENHFALPMYIVLLSIVMLIIISKRLKKNIFILTIVVVALFSLNSTFFSFISSNCGPYLWINNPHEIAYSYQKINGYDKIYFPWQPLGSLLGEKKYHLEAGLKMEYITGETMRPISNIKKYLPSEKFKIAVRPKGDPSFLVERFHANPCMEAIPELPGWSIYEISGESIKN